MSRRVGVISIDIQAGTAKFAADMEKAKGKIHEFGAAAHGSVTGVQAVSASLRVMEGNMTNNLRASERFVANVLGWGPALQAVFPLVGAIAFAGIIGELSTKAHDFFKSIQQAPEKVGGAFRELNSTLRVSNDEILVANDRLANDIAKLEGKRENTVKLALDEARASADKLAESLDKDLSSLDRLLREQAGSTSNEILAGLFGQAGTRDVAKEVGGETGFGGFRGRIAGITDPAKLKAVYEDEINVFKNAIVDAEAFQKDHSGREAIFNLQGQGGVHGLSGDMTARLEALRGVLTQLREESSNIGLHQANATLTQQKDKLSAAAENTLLGKPFGDRMAAIGAQIDAVKAKLGAIGQSQAEQNLAKAFGEAHIAITEVNKALEKRHTTLSLDNEAALGMATIVKVNTEAEAEWKTKFASATTSINDRIKSQELLTAAIGKGYEATRAANVETRLMQELGQHYNDAAWMRKNAGDVNALRSGFTGEFDAQHAEHTTAAIDKLNDQIELERELVRVQSQGAEAVRQATLAVKLRQMASVGASKEQLAAEMELYNAERLNAVASEVSKLDEKTEATNRLTAATLKGAEALRQAALANRLAEIAREGDTAIPGVFGIGARGVAAISGEGADHALKVAQAAAETDSIRKLDERISLLKEARGTEADTLSVEIALRDMENERLRLMVQQTLQLRTAGAGVKAFFMEMQEDAKSTASIIYETLNSALDRTSANLAKMATGQHPKGGFGQMWGKDLKDLGEQTTQSAFKGLMQKGLGALGAHFGIHGKADGSQNNPFWVKVAGSAPGGSPSALPMSIGDINSLGNVPSAPAGGLFGSGSMGGGIWSFVKGMFGGMMAEGGDVDPGHVYGVGDNGLELFHPRTAGTITPMSKLGTGNGEIHVHNDIDARGAALGVENRISRAIEASHQASVSQAIRAQHERARRTPRGGK